jgi:hypothetical protein
MAAFESHLKGELGVKVAFDPVALRGAFPDPKPAFWNPPDDPFAYGRTSRSFLPVEMGGSDRRETTKRFYDSYLRDQIPAAAFKTPDFVQESLKIRLINAAANMLDKPFIDPPNPRELIQRGLLHEAARDVVAKQEYFAEGLNRLRFQRDSDKQVGEWIEEANELNLNLGRAKLIKDGDRIAEAEDAIQKHWRDPRIQLLLDRMVSEVGQAEATLLLALCKHEEAERVQVRIERAGPADAAELRPAAVGAWQTALSAWRPYEQSAAAHAGFPGRSAHAMALAARAAKLAEADAKK